MAQRQIEKLTPQRRKIEKLTPLFVAKAKAGKAKPGKHCDGRNLYLLIEPNGSARWAHRYLGADSKDHWMGLGSVRDVSLKEAREGNDAARKLRRVEKVDPIKAKRDKAAKQLLEVAKSKTFQECANEYIKSHRAGWRNDKHAAQWESTLATYAFPIIGALPVQAADKALVMQVLEQEVGGATLWTAKTETAARLRGRMEAVLAWATVHGYREGPNPAQWKNHLEKLLPAKSKVAKVAHHAALPYAEMPSFMATLREQEGIAAKAFEFAILTCTRTNETLAMKWAEVDFEKAFWIIPSSRMKGGKEHRVPLSTRALAVLEEMRASGAESGADAFVFPGMRHRRPLSNMSLLMCLRRMGRGDLTAHGMRATFKTWAGEETHFPRDVIEKALAHVIGNKAEQAYERGDLFQKRRALMEAWSAFCGRGDAGSTVIEFPKAS